MTSALVDPLPDDVGTLQALVHSMVAERDAALAERDQAREQNERLLHLLRQLQRARFGRSSEKLDPDQLQLALEDVEQAVARGEAEMERHDTRLAAARARERSAERKSLPAHLPREEVVIDLDDKTCPCCGGALHVIGEDIAERLDVIPTQYRVLVTR